MNVAVMIIQLLVGLSFLIFIHELGHFLAARAFGIRVEKFYLFFDTGNFRLFRFKIGETEYGMGWLPLGGYCKISGMVDESLDTDTLKSEPKHYEYRSKPAWQRFIVITAGVFMNLLLGIFIFAMLLYGQTKSYLSVNEVNQHGIYTSALAEEIGFKNGDKIVAVNGKTFNRFEDAMDMRLFFGGKVTVERQEGSNTNRHTIQIPDNTYKRLPSLKHGTMFLEPTMYSMVVDVVVENKGAANAGLRQGDIIYSVDSLVGMTFGFFRDYVAGLAGDSVNIVYVRGKDTIATIAMVDTNGRIGVGVKSPYNGTPYTVANSFYYGTKDAFDLIIANAKGLGKVMSGKEKASESIQGPIGIATIYGPTWDWSRFWFITGMLSLILAFMNILPIPGLDGGHMMFTLYEMITRRKVSDSIMEKAQLVGMILLICLMIFAFGNDIIRLLK